MSIQHLTLALISLVISTGIFAEDKETQEAEKSNARAYRAHLLTFTWSDKMSSEQINYENIYQLEDIQRFENDEDAILSSSIINKTSANEGEEINPFAQYQALIKRRVNILSNQTWPMIFEDQGSINFAEFHSDNILDGYPELTGQIQVKLGRYLETKVQYQHYLFDTFTTQIKEPETINNSLIFDELDPFLDSPDITKTETVQLFEPALVLRFEVERKTASKKLNYLDHPTVGSLLYFEPISVDDAEHELMLQALTEEEMVRDAEASISLEAEEEEINKLIPITENDGF